MTTKTKFPPIDPTKNPIKFLDKLENVLSGGHWTQFDFDGRKNNRRCFCIAGGAEYVASGGTYNGRQGDTTGKYMKDEMYGILGFDNERDAFDWNDTAGRKFTDVKARINEARQNARRPKDKRVSAW